MIYPAAASANLKWTFSSRAFCTSFSIFSALAAALLKKKNLEELERKNFSFLWGLRLISFVDELMRLYR